MDTPSQQTGEYLAGLLLGSTGCWFDVRTNAGVSAVRGAILLTTVNARTNLGAEGYELTVAPDSVVIRAPAPAGVFYGVQSLLQLFPPQVFSPRAVTKVAWTAPCVYIQDQPRFPWRGAMLDVSRHFIDKQEVERVLDGMALHKLNTFHWHLVDDHGWRVEILSYTNLTYTGAWRASMDYGQNPAASTAYRAAAPSYGGYYTQADIREVVAYAKQRYITVVPEIELPAHCTSGVASYPQYSCGYSAVSFNMDNINYAISLYSLAGPGCWTFFTNVLTEVMGLFPGQYIHCGGDEVVATGDTDWTTYSYDKTNMQALGISPSGGTASIQAYQRWFSTNLTAFLRANGRTLVGWGDIAAAGVITNAVIMDLGTYAVTAAEAGQGVVMCPTANCYVNYCETGSGSTVPPTEPYFIVGGEPAFVSVQSAYTFEPVPTNLPSAYATNILGAQCNLWSEYVPSPENVEFKLFPRLSALAEVVWSFATNRNYTDFTNRLVIHEQRLAQMGFNYNREAVTQIGTWAGVPASPTTVTNTYDITPYVTTNGEIDVSFYNTSTVKGLDIYWVSLLENGAQVDSDNYTSFAGGASYTETTTRSLPYYVLHLPWFHPGSTYALKASIGGDGGTNNAGTVYLANWN